MDGCASRLATSRKDWIVAMRFGTNTWNLLKRPTADTFYRIAALAAALIVLATAGVF